MRLRHYFKQGGFSLIEMAVVLIILGFILGALLMPLRAQHEQLSQSQTENTLEIAKKSLLGFAQSRGRFPCPATATSNGIEDPTPVTGTCTAQLGFLPAATLGIQPANASGFAIDGWNNPIRYAVTIADVGGAAAPDFTTSNEMSNVGITALDPDLKVCIDSSATNCSASNYLVKDAVAVVFSTGENFGLSAGVDEASNLTATTTFYSRAPTVATAAPSKEFDDMVTWISPYVLYNAMIEAGQLH